MDGGSASARTAARLKTNPAPPQVWRQRRRRGSKGMSMEETITAESVRIDELLAANNRSLEEKRQIEQRLRFLWPQDRISRWVDSTFGKQTIDSRFRKLKEEVDELFEAHRNADEQGLRMEAADVAIVLMHLAEVAGFDLMLAIQEKMAVNQARDWRAHLAAKGKTL